MPQGLRTFITSSTGQRETLGLSLDLRAVSSCGKWGGGARPAGSVGGVCDSSSWGREFEPRTGCRDCLKIRSGVPGWLSQGSMRLLGLGV